MTHIKLLGDLISCPFERKGSEVILTVPQTLIDQTVTLLNADSEKEDLTKAFGDLLFDVTVGDTRLIVKRLAYRVAIYVNPTRDYGYDDRYCICSKEVALLAIEKFKEVGEIWYWQKHHNKNLRCVGNYVYHDSGLCVPEFALREVSWNAEDLRKAFPFV
jgi:hypothetical protein